MLGGEFMKFIGLPEQTISAVSMNHYVRPYYPGGYQISGHLSGRTSDMKKTDIQYIPRKNTHIYVYMHIKLELRLSVLKALFRFVLLYLIFLLSAYGLHDGTSCLL